MYVKNVHDFAEVYFDGEKKTSIDRTLYSVEGKTTLKDVIFKKKKGESSPFLMPALSGERKIGVLVDTMGRVNYGENMLDRKGISDIYLGIQRLMNYDVWTLPLDNLDKLKYSSSVKKEEPVFLKGSFKDRFKSRLLCSS